MTKHGRSDNTFFLHNCSQSYYYILCVLIFYLYIYPKGEKTEDYLYNLGGTSRGPGSLPTFLTFDQKV